MRIGRPACQDTTKCGGGLKGAYQGKTDPAKKKLHSVNRVLDSNPSREKKRMRIGTVPLSNNLILAPLAGITDLAFRLMAREFGCGLVVTEMVSAMGLVHGGRRTQGLLESDPDEKPLCVQLFGCDAEVMAKAAAMCQRQGADVIDINMGCPVRKVVKSGAGLALMRDPALAGRIVAAVRRSIRIPLTVKMRSGWSKSEPAAVRIARIAESEGADAVTVHPRYKEPGFSESADWEVIGQVRQTVPIPVIGNGDVASGEDAAAMLERTGCHGVMLGRGALGRPWIFRQITGYLNTGETPPDPPPVRRMEIIRRHFEKLCEIKGPRLATKVFRKHLIWYTRALPGAARFRRGLAEIVEPEALMDYTERFVLHEEGAAPSPA